MKITTFIQNFINIACQYFISAYSFTVARSRGYKLSKLLRRSLYAFFILFISCKGGNQGMLDETPTRGKIKITADESFQPIIDTEIYTFTSLYKNAYVTPSYKPEYDVINDFMNDSVKVIVTSKKLTDDQIRYLRDTLIVARTVTFAYDALAIITNRENKDTLLKYDAIKNIFLGKTTRWGDINQKSKLGDIRVIFDNTKSGNIRYFKELFEINEDLPGNFYALKNNPEVVDFVSRNPDALGIISVNWISDKDDTTSMNFVKKVNVVAISSPIFDDGYYYRPYQGSIYEKSYPFVREVYMISRETFTGLGSGFIQWATGEQGQRIVLKSGLVPATMPIRLVQIRN